MISDAVTLDTEEIAVSALWISDCEVDEEAGDADILVHFVAPFLQRFLDLCFEDAVLVARIAELRRAGRLHLPDKAGVLVKAPKPGQDRRFDLPSIGSRTVEAAAAAGLAGIAVEARGAITADLSDMIRTADAAGLFLVGIAPPASPRGGP